MRIHAVSCIVETTQYTVPRWESHLDDTKIGTYLGIPRYAMLLGTSYTNSVAQFSLSDKLYPTARGRIKIISKDYTVSDTIPYRHPTNNG